jgi:hypothetical protein
MEKNRKLTREESLNVEAVEFTHVALSLPNIKEYEQFSTKTSNSMIDT